MNLIRKTLWIGLILGLAMVLVVPSAEGKMKKLNYQSLNQYEVPSPEKVVLSNGLTVYILEDHALPTFWIAARMNRCGGYLDPPQKVGLAGMVGAVMRTGGTQSKSGDEIDLELESIGAAVETSIGTVSGSAGANGLIEHAEKVISILADVLRRPAFADDKIELERTAQRSDISRRNDDPFGVTIREFRQLIYGADSPYARNPEYATIDGVTRDDMVMFHKLVVQPNNVQMAVCGDFSREEMLAMIRKYFEDWPAGQMELPLPPEVTYEFRPSVNYIARADVNQSNIFIGHVGGMMGDSDYAATIVMNSVLGGFFGSRIMDNVRTKLGLAYTARASFSFDYSYPGIFYAYAGTKSGSTAAAIREMIKQIKSMQTLPPTVEEMKKAKDGWLNSFVFNFDTKAEILGSMMIYDLYGMPLDYLQQLKEQVEKITPADVMAVAQRKLNADNLQIVVMGKGEDFDEPLSVFGTVNEIDITIPVPAETEFAATDEELGQGTKWLGDVVEASGGLANFQKVKSVSTQGTVTVHTPQGSIALSMRNVLVYPDRSAQVISSPMGEQTEIYVGTEGWTVTGGQVQLMTADQLAEQKKDLTRNAIMLFSRSDNPDYQVAFRGEEEFSGQAAARLDFLAAEGGQFSMYINPDTRLPLGLKYQGQTIAGPGEVVQTIIENKVFNGLSFPVVIKQEAGGLTFDIQLSTVTVNGEVDESLFVKPSGL